MDQRLYELFLDSLIGNPVENDQGECLGKIVELMIDPDSGHVKNVVLSLGKPPNFGSALSAIPWEALKLSEKKAAQRVRAGGTGSGSPNPPRTDGPKPSDHCSVYTYPVRRFR